MSSTPNRLAGTRVLIPRGGEFGDRLAAAVVDNGGEPIVAPMIEFPEPSDQQELVLRCGQLSAGAFDWVAVTSATTVGALVHHGATIPDRTRVAAVGPATRKAMVSAGYRVDFMPKSDYSAAGMIAEWPTSGGSVWLPQSAIAEPTLAEGLSSRGLSVTATTAYETRMLDAGERIRRQLADGTFTAVLLTSASVARAVATHGAPWPSETAVICIGASTATGARAAGLPVHAVAEPSTAEALVGALCSHLSGRHTDRPTDLPTQDSKVTP